MVDKLASETVLGFSARLSQSRYPSSSCLIYRANSARLYEDSKGGSLDRFGARQEGPPAQASGAKLRAWRILSTCLIRIVALSAHLVGHGHDTRRVVAQEEDHSLGPLFSDYGQASLLQPILLTPFANVCALLVVLLFSHRTRYRDCLRTCCSNENPSLENLSVQECSPNDSPVLSEGRDVLARINRP